MDTSVLHFYPTLFVLAMDIMDMVGNMVWERIKWKAEFAEDGTRICSLPGLSSSFWISLSLSLFVISNEIGFIHVKDWNVEAGYV